MSTPGPGTLEPFLTFRLGRRAFAVPAVIVRECLWLPRLTALEGSPPWVLGTFDLRGRLVTVVSLDVYFGHPPPAAASRDQLLVAERPDALVGIHMSEALAVDIPERVMPLADGHEGVEHPAIQREMEANGRILPVLELAAVSLRGGAPGGSADDAEDRLARFEAALDEADRQTLENRREALRPAQSAGASAKQGDFLLMELGGETFALPAEDVSELAPLGAVAPAPATPEHIRGFVGLRGEVVTLVDVRPTLGVTAGPLWEPPLMVVFTFDQHPTGIPVDRAPVVTRAEPEPTAELPVAVQTAAGQWTTACIRVNDRVVPVLDLHRLLRDGGLVVDASEPVPAYLRPTPHPPPQEGSPP